MNAKTSIQLLVVDDDRNHREMLQALLEEWGYAPQAWTTARPPWPSAANGPLILS